MSLAIRLVPDILRSVAFGSLNAVYIGIGTAMTKPIRMFILQNWTNADLMISFDGIHDHLPFSSGTFLELDITANKTIQQGFFLAQGTRFYVKLINPADIPTTGAVYLTAFYGADI
jgi:hypothetical protein